MSHDLLAPIWTQLDHEPPIFFADHADSGFASIRDRLVSWGYLREVEPSQFAMCDACGGGHLRLVIWVEDPSSGTRHGYIPCPNCGSVRIDPSRLLRWRVDVSSLLAAVFTAASGRSALSEQVPGRLWYLGSATWFGRSRQAYFVRAAHIHSLPMILATLQQYPRAVLFHPTEHSARLWGTTTPNPSIALESVVTLRPDGLSFDKAVVEGRLADAGFREPLPESPPKRATRAANIARLTEEVIEHLKRARAHALASLDLSKEAKRLERPTKKKLGELVGLEPYEVTRCFDDESARELNLYWELALDLDAVMTFHGPISIGSAGE